MIPEQKSKLNKLNLGCGADIIPGWINADYITQPGVNMVFDFNKFPWPIKDNTIDEVFASHVLEHVDDLIKVMKELNRICKKGAKIVIRGPHFSCGVSYRDPTHRRTFSYFTFDHFTKIVPSYYKRDESELFIIEQRKLNYTRLSFTFLNYIFNPIINISPSLYERFLCWVFPCSEVICILRVKK